MGALHSWICRPSRRASLRSTCEHEWSAAVSAPLRLGPAGPADRRLVLVADTEAREHAIASWGADWGRVLRNLPYPSLRHDHLCVALEKRPLLSDVSQQPIIPLVMAVSVGLG